jgi:hypothetical protein
VYRTQNAALRPGGRLGSTAESHSRSEWPTGYKKKNLRSAAYFNRMNGPCNGAVHSMSVARGTRSVQTSGLQLHRPDRLGLTCWALVACPSFDVRTDFSSFANSVVHPIEWPFSYARSVPDVMGFPNTATCWPI